MENKDLAAKAIFGEVVRRITEKAVTELKKEKEEKKGSQMVDHICCCVQQIQQQEIHLLIDFARDTLCLLLFARESPFVVFNLERKKGPNWAFRAEKTLFIGSSPVFLTLFAEELLGDETGDSRATYNMRCAILGVLNQFMGVRLGLLEDFFYNGKYIVFKSASLLQFTKETYDKEVDCNQDGTEERDMFWKTLIKDCCSFKEEEEEGDPNASSSSAPDPEAWRIHLGSSDSDPSVGYDIFVKMREVREEDLDF